MRFQFHQNLPNHSPKCLSHSRQQDLGFPVSPQLRHTLILADGVQSCLLTWGHISLLPQSGWAVLQTLSGHLGFLYSEKWHLLYPFSTGLCLFPISFSMAYKMNYWQNSIFDFSALDLMTRLSQSGAGQKTSRFIFVLMTDLLKTAFAVSVYYFQNMTLCL